MLTTTLLISSFVNAGQPTKTDLLWDEMKRTLEEGWGDIAAKYDEVSDRRDISRSMIMELNDLLDPIAFKIRDACAEEFHVPKGADDWWLCTDGAWDGKIRLISDHIDLSKKVTKANG